jgi:hypothetical protein
VADNCTGGKGNEPDQDHLGNESRAVRLRQHTQGNQAETEIVGLGKRMQTTVKVGEAQQPDGASQEEECSRERKRDGESVSHGPIRPDPAAGVRRRMPR